MAQYTRRTIMAAGPGAGVLLLGLPAWAGGTALGDDPPKPAGAWPGFPRQQAELVREVVGASHRDEARVRELVDAHPALVNAWWDWGFGDWESPLGAASHTGRRSIAEFLIERGARVDVYAAAMLGWTDAVRAMIEGSPGVPRSLGPHCINLCDHARAGGAPAAATLKYLESRGDADGRPAVAPITAEARARLAGVFAYGPGADNRFTIRDEKERLELVTPDGGARRLHYVGDGAFFPAGVPSVRIRFEGAASGPPATVTIHDHGPRLAAQRITP